MPFKLKYLNQLKHRKIDEALEYVFKQTNVFRPKIWSSQYNNGLFEKSPSERLLDLINNASFGLQVLAKLLDGNDRELNLLKPESQVVKASIIFLKFKIQGYNYRAKTGPSNTCLHDAIECHSVVEELTPLLIHIGADPSKRNAKGYTAAAFYMKQILPIASRNFQWAQPFDKPIQQELFNFITWVGFYYPDDTLRALRGLSLYLPLKDKPGLLDYYPNAYHGNSILHWASKKLSSDTVQWLLEQGACPDLLNHDLVKPIHLAVMRQKEYSSINFRSKETTEIIVHLLMASLKKSLPKGMVPDASQIIDALFVEIFDKDVRKQVVHTLFTLNYAHDFGFSKTQLLELLDLNQNTRYHSEIVRQTKIGKGAYGQVYKGYIHYVNEPDKAVAIKFHSDSNSDVHRTIQEAAILSQLSHPNIIAFMCTMERCYFGYAMHYADGGDLLSFSKKTPNLWGHYAYTLGLQLNAGLRYLHSENYVHLDLKPANILLENTDNPATIRLFVADFGSCAKVGQQRPYAVTTSSYCSPEGFNYDKPYQIEHDIFSFGCCIGFMNTQKEPWSELKANSGTKIDDLIQSKVLQGERTTFKDTIMQPEAAVLVRWCWEEGPSERPNHDQIDSYINCVIHPSHSI